MTTWAQDKLSGSVTNKDYMIDYSAGKIRGEVIASAGYTGCKRYIDRRDLLGIKHTNREEYQDHLANGLHDTLVMEVGKNDALGGFDGGRAKAQRAVDGAEYIGYQGDRIAFCCDRHFVSQDAQTISPQIWQDYLGGAASIVGIKAVEAYGFSEAIDAAVGHATYFWQCGSISVVRNVSDAWQDNNWLGFLSGIGIDRSLLKKSITVATPETTKRLRDLMYTSVTLGTFGQSGFKSGVRFEDGTFVDLTSDSKALSSVQENQNKGLITYINCQTEAVFNAIAGVTPTV